MFYKEDWGKAQERFSAFWQGEIIDRCCLAVKAPRNGRYPVPAEPPESPAELRKWWLDAEDNLKRMLAQFERTYYGGEAYPATTMDLGASIMSGFYGSPVELRKETVWYHACVEDWAAYPLEFDPETNLYYQAVIDATRFYAQESQERFMVSLPELGSVMDDLSLMRGMQSLLFDMLDSPEVVSRAADRMAGTWARVHNELYRLALPANHAGCCIEWMQTWAPGPHFQMSCDFSAILSPKLFQQFIAPEIQEYLKVNDYSVYHWDGPDALKHLDSLLAMQEIDAIQWTPGDGSPPYSYPEWIPYYRRIQAAGKKLILPYVKIDEVESLLSQLSSRGLFIATTAASQEEASELLKKVSLWTRE